MADIQFEVTTDLSTVANTQIETNFEAVKAWLTEELAPYATMVVTPEAIGDAKKTRANIRKVGESIDSQRKAIKKMWNKPYEEYEAKCKELTGIVSEAVSNLDGQIKEMENAEKQEKRKRLEAFFDKNVFKMGVSGYITFDAVFDSKWLNATFSEIDAANSITEQLEGIHDSLEVLRGMNSPYESAMLSEFSKTHSLPKAIAEGRRLEAIDRAEEDRRAREELRKVQEAEADKNARETAETLTMGDDPEDDSYAPHPSFVAPSIRPSIDIEAPKPKLYTLQFEVTMTMAQANALKAFFAKSGITYKRIN